jgi:NAD(P)-dependent dehydrogenase (short-subunit alcohol dehydrogenase family)
MQWGFFFAVRLRYGDLSNRAEGEKSINIGSIASKRPAQLLAHYAASKFAVLGFAKSLASEVARYNINVNCVCPGLVKTLMQDREVGWEAKLRGISEEKVKEEYIEAIPLGRLEEPEDIAKLILFLASDDANYITGQAFNVAGGMEMAV